MHHHGQDCLRLRVDVVRHKGSGKNHLDKSKAENTGKNTDGGKAIFPANGGVHNPANHLPAGEDSTQASHSSSLTEGSIYYEGMMKSNTDSSLFPQMTLLRWSQTSRGVSDVRERSWSPISSSSP